MESYSIAGQDSLASSSNFQRQFSRCSGSSHAGSQMARCFSIARVLVVQTALDPLVALCTVKTPRHARSVCTAFGIATHQFMSICCFGHQELDRLIPAFSICRHLAGERHVHNDAADSGAVQGPVRLALVVSILLCARTFNSPVSSAPGTNGMHAVSSCLHTLLQILPRMLGYTVWGKCFTALHR